MTVVIRLTRKNYNFLKTMSNDCDCCYMAQFWGINMYCEYHTSFNVY